MGDDMTREAIAKLIAPHSRKDLEIIDALADALGGLLRSHSGCGDCTPAVVAARAALRAARRLP